jgi:hypothetical protein
VWLLTVAADDLWDNDQPELWHRLLEGASSPICEVLGIQQRQWLQQQLTGSKATLNVIASGSVLAGGCRGGMLPGFGCSHTCLEMTVAAYVLDEMRPAMTSC